MKWFMKYKRWVKIIKDTSLGITEFHFRNQMGEDIEILPAEVI
jgi:ribonuclease G